MMICEPKRGFRQVDITGRRTKIESAQSMKHIVDLYPKATVIRAVLDNLNTHKMASLYEARLFLPNKHANWRGNWHSTTRRSTAVG